MENHEKYTVPATRFTETPETYELMIALPGISHEEAELHIDGKTLVLKTHASLEQPSGVKVLVTEFERTNYALNAELPEMANLETLHAQLKNGLMTVTLAKRPESKPRQIEIH